MNAPVIKGYCPGALRPMQSGDGIVVRIRPVNGCISSDQASGIANLSTLHGNGLIDLSSRANLQLRGVTEATYPALIEGLRDLSLLDADEATESRRNIIVTPFWQTGDGTETLASTLTKALQSPSAPTLSGKFGFAIDTGDQPVLQNASADIRLERDATGGLILVADGIEVGKPVTPQSAIAEAMKLAEWFARNATTQTRMTQLLQDGALLSSGFDTPRQNQTFLPVPNGTLVGIAFGQMHANTLTALAKFGSLRMTPWRMLLIENAQNLSDIPDVITDPTDPLLRITACTGASACAQALSKTRPLARTIAPHLKPDQFVHISGCAKGCAHPNPAPLTFTGTARGFNLVRQGRASDTPEQTALTPDDIIKVL